MSKKLKQIAIFLIVLLISMGVFEYVFLSLNQAQAYENAYIKDTSFFNNETNGLVFKFTVKTTFDINAGSNQHVFYTKPNDCSNNACMYSNLSGYGWSMVLNDAFEPNPLNYITLEAGKTYEFYLKEAHDGGNQPITKARFEYHLGHTLTSADYLQNYITSQFWGVGIADNATVAYYSEGTSLTIDFPLNNAEIAGPFTITGTLTQPSPYSLTGLSAIFYWYDENNPENEFNFITGWIDELTATSSQAISINIENLPKSDPKYIGIRFSGIGGGGFNFSENTIKIKTMHVVGQWPPPSWEGPNVISFFNTGEIDIYSPTPIGGSYYIKTPTSTITFILTPEIRADNNIWMYEQLEGGNRETVLATTTVESLTGSFFGIIWNRLFDVEGIFAETSTPAWLTAIITSKTGTLISQNNWRILGADQQEIGDYGFWGNFINQQLKQFLYIQPETKQAFYSLGDTMKTKIPFCYFFDIKNSFQGLDLSTSTTAMPGLHFTVEGQDMEMNLLDTSFLETTGFINTFKDLQRMAFWLIFLVYLYILGKAGPKQLQMNM